MLGRRPNRGEFGHSYWHSPARRPDAARQDTCHGSRRGSSVTLQERLHQLVAALPSDDSAIVITRADLIILLGEVAPDDTTHDLTVEEVAQETGRAPSTVRGWLLEEGGLQGYKLNGRDWRIPQRALRDYLSQPSKRSNRQKPAIGSDISDWRTIGTGTT